MGEQSAAGYREGHRTKQASMLSGLSLAIADGNRSFFRYQIVAVTVLCIQMSAYSFRALSP